MTLDAELAKLSGIVGAVEVPFESKSLDVEGNGTLILRGLAAGFDADRMGEQFDPASFKRAFWRTSVSARGGRTLVAQLSVRALKARSSSNTAQAATAASVRAA